VTLKFAIEMTDIYVNKGERSMLGQRLGVCYTYTYMPEYIGTGTYAGTGIGIYTD
jgi:hypothetical protein